MKNRSTYCNYTVNKKYILEGHILGYGDNYPCLVVYNPFEAKFVALEFGYAEDGYLYREHEIRSYTVPWKILGRDLKILKGYPYNFDYIKEQEQYYKDEK